MRDDFQLFDESTSGEGIDPDVAMVTAYLARELTPIQIAAVEDRLASDANFLRNVEPILTAWLASQSELSLINSSRNHMSSLKPAQIDTGWQRYLAQRVDPAAVVSQATSASAGRKSAVRRVPLLRAAAILALFLIPAAIVAQGVVYSANHSDAFGHVLARRIVAAILPAKREQIHATPSGPEPQFGLPSAAAVPQGAFRPISATEDLRISGANREFYDLRVSPTGVMATYEGAEGPMRVFSPSGDEIHTLGGGLPSGLRTLYWGFAGESIYVFDNRGLFLYTLGLTPTARITSVRRVTVETPGPPGTTPQLGQAIGGFAYPRIWTVYPDGGLLIRQQFPLTEVRKALGNRFADSELSQRPSLLIRTNVDNNFVGFALANLPGKPEPCERYSPVAGIYGPVRQAIPFCEVPGMHISSDGNRVVHTVSISPNTDPSVIRIVQVTIGGDTVYSREYRIPTIRVSQQESDSARDAILERLTRSAEPTQYAFADSILHREMPTYRQPVSEIFVGQDGSVVLWLFRFLPNSQFLLLDPRGDPVGVFTMPRYLLPTEVSRNAVWGVERRADAPAGTTRSDLVRFRLGG